MVDNALIGTTEFDIFSLDPATCAENWRTHEEYPPSLLPANRGAAYLDGMLFRGTQDGRVLAYDFKTGKRMWETTIADPKRGESVPSAPIAWRRPRLSSATPAETSRAGRGTCSRSTPRPARSSGNSSWCPRPRATSSADRWARRRSTHRLGKTRPASPSAAAEPGRPTPSTPKTGLLYVPGGNPAPDFVIGAREGDNLFTDSVVVLDAKTGDYKNHFQIVPKDWHDWDVSNPPILIQTMGGKQLMAVAPKDGYLYGFDLADNRLCCTACR